MNRRSAPPYRLFYSPHYASNHYQSLLHAALLNAGMTVMPVGVADVSSIPDQVLHDSAPFVFHQHWLREVYRGQRPDREGFNTLDRYFGRLRLLRALGGKVFWTVHNLLDHDITADEQLLNRYCIQQMAKVAERILIHDDNARLSLEDVCGFGIDCKRFSVLHHPLYDAMLQLRPACPRELKDRGPIGVFTYLCFGLMRPYKGGLELFTHYLSCLKNGKLTNTRLIIAGFMQDKALLRAHARLNETWRQHVTLINRRVSDEELAWLCRHSDIAVLPYRQILSSGSYFQAATFALPAIVPRSGMFVSMIEDEINGLKYHSVSELGALLLRAKALGSARLQEMGRAALARCRPQSASEYVSARYADIVRHSLQGEQQL